MFYICVICMVDTTQDSLVLLTKERRRLWETIVSPLIDIVKLKSSALRICSDCNQLLTSMLHFQNTMVNGVKNFLMLQEKFKPIRNRNICSKPPVLFDSYLMPIPDQWLPVATEEVACSTGSLDNIEYAVLIPINESSTYLRCGEVEHISEVSGSHVEEATPLKESAKEAIKEPATDLSESAGVRKTKLNRLLYDAIRVTLQSTTLKQEFETKYEPEPESNSDQKSLSESENKPDRISLLKSGQKPDRISLLKSEQKLDRISLLRSEQTPNQRSLLKSKQNSERISLPESEQKPDGISLPESEQKSDRISLPESEQKPNRISVAESERKQDRISLPESEYSQAVQCNLELSEVTLGEQLIKAGRDPGLKSGINLELDSVESAHSCSSACESIADSESTVSCSSDYDDAEHYPNVTFARSFNEILEDGQIHSHIVTNPPNEWPCSWERCILQDLYSENETLSGSDSGSEETERGHVDPIESDGGLNGHVEITKSDEVQKRLTKRSRRKTRAKQRRKCRICSKIFIIGARFWNHCDREHRAELTEKCDLCRERCASGTELQLHKLKHRLNESVKCPMCSATFKSTRWLREHAAVHILSQTQDIQTQDTQTLDTQTQDTQLQHTQAQDTQTRNMTDTQINGQRRRRRHDNSNTAMYNGKRKQTEITQYPTDTQTNRQTRKRWQNTDTMYANGKRKAKTITEDKYNGRNKIQGKKRIYKNKDLYIDGMTYEVETDIANGTHINYDIYTRNDGHDYIYTQSLNTHKRNGHFKSDRRVRRSTGDAPVDTHTYTADTHTRTKTRKVYRQTGRVRKRRKTGKRVRIQAPTAEQEQCLPIITNVTSLCNMLFD